MSAFYVWSPSKSDNNASVVEVLLTRGDTDSIAEGSMAFGQEIIKSIGLDDRVTGCAVKAFRSNYFSEYLGESDWRDVWQPVWKVEIAVNKPNVLVPQLRTNGIGTDAEDESWTPQKRLRDDTMLNCLVIADFKNSKGRERARNAIVESGAAGPTRIIPTFHETRIVNKYEELQIDLGPFPARFYSEGASYAESTIDICRRLKGSVNFQQRPK